VERRIHILEAKRCQRRQAHEQPEQKPAALTNWAFVARPSANALQPRNARLALVSSCTFDWAVADPMSAASMRQRSPAIATLMDALISASTPAQISPPSQYQLSALNQKILHLLSFLHRLNQPPRPCSSASPSLAGWASIFRWDLPAFQPASTLNGGSAQYRKLTSQLSGFAIQGLVDILTQFQEGVYRH
jgi:hypothetical protein